MGKVWGQRDVLPGDEAAGRGGQIALHPMTYLELVFFVVHLLRGLLLPTVGAPPSWCTKDTLTSAERAHWHSACLDRCGSQHHAAVCALVGSPSSKSSHLAKPLGETPRESTKRCVLMRRPQRSEGLLVTASLDPLRVRIGACVCLCPRCVHTCIHVGVCSRGCPCVPACVRVCGGLYLPVRLRWGAAGLTPTSF